MSADVRRSLEDGLRYETCRACGRVLLWSVGELVCVVRDCPEYGKPQDRAGDSEGER